MSPLTLELEELSEKSKLVLRDMRHAEAEADVLQLFLVAQGFQHAGDASLGETAPAFRDSRARLKD